MTDRVRWFTLAVVVAAVASCSRDGGKADTPAAAQPGAFRVTDAQRARLKIVRVASESFRPTVEVTGTVAFNDDKSTQVLAAISGPVVRLFTDVGAVVRAGDPLAAVSSPDFATAVSTYRKALEADRNARRILQRDEQLFQNDAIARNDLDQARADAASAAADLDAAVQGLRALGVSDSTIAAVRDGRQTAPVEGAIRAPIGGVVVERLINPGQLLQAGTTPTFTVADLGTMWVLANVYDNDLGLVSAAEDADILTDARATPVRGRVDYVAALVDPGTRATSVRIVAANPDHVLKRDMFVRVHIHSNRDRRGLLVPTGAVLRDEDNLPFVFLAHADGTFGRRRVTLGYRVADRYEIVQGLDAGDQVVADGALFIQFAESQ